MFERGIEKTEVSAVINLGEMIQEYPDYVPYPIRLLLSWYSGP
ncbi:hypothetical protein NTGBS_720026 [Candidatus Nitrotoga sp. BS]|nr:hypothetical protein NTGBS_720026 [Candidatus Nitrotoga sp. BS]